MATESATAASGSATQPALRFRSLAGIAVSRTILAALLLAFHDPLLIYFAATLAVVGLLGATIDWRSRRQQAVAHLLKAAIYGVAALLAHGALAQDRNDADLLVRMLGVYRQQHGSYPARLEMLVPTLLPALPRPGLKGFHYLPQQDSYWLFYRPSVAGPCSFRPEAGAWDCQAD